jgi:hypothetical protein
MPRGGKRENAGRPATGRSTKVIRVSEGVLPYLDHIEDIVMTLKSWDVESQGKTSPRWSMLKKMMDEVRPLIE